ncbi:MAG: Lrp/AsnC family transcriptional regulator [Acidobacteriota bacterium]
MIQTPVLDDRSLHDCDLDEVDLEIVRALQDNARTQNAELARRVDMAPSAVLKRVRKLEERGVLRGFRALVSPPHVGLKLLAYVSVKANESMSEWCTGEALARIPEVQEVHHVAGEDCYLIKVRTSSTEALGRLLREKLGTIKTVVSTRSTIVLETIKEEPGLPLGPFEGDGDVSKDLR